VLGPVVVRVGSSSERVYGPDGAAEPGYRPDPASGRRLADLAEATGGRVYGGGEVGAAAREARRLLGSGPTATRGTERRSVSLAPYAALLALLPLGFVLWTRNIR
jgi:hypothetical protein